MTYQSIEKPETTAMPHDQPPYKVPLSDGRVAILIEKPIGKHAVEASRLAKGDQSLVQAAMVSVVYRFNDKRLTMEEVLELPFSDYIELAGAVTQIGGN